MRLRIKWPCMRVIHKDEMSFCPKPSLKPLSSYLVLRMLVRSAHGAIWGKLMTNICKFWFLEVICGYSDTPLTVTLLPFPKGVTVSGHYCTIKLTNFPCGENFLVEPTTAKLPNFVGEGITCRHQQRTVHIGLNRGHCRFWAQTGFSSTEQKATHDLNHLILGHIDSIW